MKRMALVLAALFSLVAAAQLRAQTIGGSWRIVGDTNAMPGLTLRLVELGPDLTEGIIVRGTWFARRVGCEPTSDVKCFLQGDAIGLRTGGHLDLDIVPASVYGMSGNLSLDVASGTTMKGAVGVTFHSGKLLATDKVTLIRIP